MNITLYPLADYNNGHLNPFTIELDNLDADEYRQEIAKGLWFHSNGGNVLSTRCGSCDHVVIGSQLNECPECGNTAPWIDDEGETDELGLEHKDTNEEWVVCDSEDIPDQLINEYDLDPKFWDYKELVDRSHLDPEAIAAGIEAGIDLDHIEDAYAGEYRSNVDFAQRFAEDIGAINDDATWPNDCIDWDRAARELMYDYIEENGYYFNKNY